MTIVHEKLSYPAGCMCTGRGGGAISLILKDRYRISVGDQMHLKTLDSPDAICTINII